MRLFASVVSLGLVALVACSEDPDSSSSSSSGGSSSGGSSSGASGATSSSGASSSSGTTTGAPYSTDPRTGIATFYAANGSGNCSFDPSPGDLDVVALAPPDYADSAACGACVKVTGPKGTVTVRVVDSCPECEAGHLDLSREAFAKIAELEAGRVPISFQTVDCAVTGPLAYHFKQGSSQYWTAIQVRNHRLPVTKLEYQKAGAWVAMKRLDYNYFVEAEGVGPQAGGLRLRVTAADGKTLEDTLPTILDNGTAPGAGQF